MLKVLKKFACVISIILVLFALSLSACSSSTGYINTLNSLVSSGVISENNLKNIAAIRNGSLQIVTNDQSDILELETIEYTITPVAEQISDEQKSNILNAFDKFVEERYQAAHVNCKVASSEIITYYGTYDGYIVTEINFTLSGLNNTNNESDLIISNYYLGKINENNLIVCWAPNS